MKQKFLPGHEPHVNHDLESAIDCYEDAKAEQKQLRAHCNQLIRSKQLEVEGFRDGVVEAMLEDPECRTNDGQMNYTRPLDDGTIAQYRDYIKHRFEVRYYDNIEDLADGKAGKIEND